MEEVTALQVVSRFRSMHVDAGLFIDFRMRGIGRDSMPRSGANVTQPSSDDW